MKFPLLPTDHWSWRLGLGTRDWRYGLQATVQRDCHAMTREKEFIEFIEFVGFVGFVELVQLRGFVEIDRDWSSTLGLPGLPRPEG
jgi:hypothetical protein